MTEIRFVYLFSICFVLFFIPPEMASLAATEPAACPGATPAAESVVPACMFAPDRGCGDDLSGTDDFEDGEGTNGESADRLHLSNKVGLAVNRPLYARSKLVPAGLPFVLIREGEPGAGVLLRHPRCCRTAEK